MMRISTEAEWRDIVWMGKGPEENGKGGGGVKNKKTDVEQFSHIVPCPYVQLF